MKKSRKSVIDTLFQYLNFVDIRDVFRPLFYLFYGLKYWCL